MPVVIEDFQAEITPETEPGANGASARPEGAAEAAAHAGQPSLQAWLALRDLAAEREARLGID
jgi:hypothetical protein